jgi:Glycosyl transferase family 1
LDFAASLDAAQNQHINFFQENIAAMAQAQKMIGKPDLVISDYEPVSAQYAYAYDAPLITVDQQSKYLIG